jgi:hypothetical protein
MSYTHIGAPTVFNNTLPNGGDSSTSLSFFLGLPIISLKPLGTTNFNQWYQSGDTAYIIICSCMVLIMISGIGFLYSGLARRKSALSMIWACMGSFSIIGNIPMVFLGLLSRLFLHRHLRLHWQPRPFRPHKYTWGAESRESFDTGVTV